MLKIQFTKHAHKFLKKLPPKQALQLKIKIQELQADPFPHNSRSLLGYPDYYRTTAGEYRIVYHAKDNTLFISLVGKRNDNEVYKKLKRIT